MAKLSASTSHAIRQFSFWIANGTVGHPLLDHIDYTAIFEEPSALEQAYAIFANGLELDADGLVLNAKDAEPASRTIHPQLRRPGVRGGSAVRRLGSRAALIK